MARSPTQTTTPLQPLSEIAQAAKANKPPPIPLDVRRQGGPTRKTLGAENCARLLRACHQIVEPITVVAVTLPEVGRALGALNAEIGKAALLQIKAESEFQQALAVNGAELERGAQRFAAKLAAVDVNPAISVKDRANALRNEAHRDWEDRYEREKAELAAKHGASVVAALDAAETALQRVELRAGLDDTAPDPKLAAAVLRTIEAEPTLLRPRKAKELLDRAMRLDDQPVLLALEVVLPSLQEVLERGAPALTRNAQMQTGQPSAATADAVAVVSMLRSLRAQRLTKPAIAKARELFEALRWLALKTIGVDAADPASVATLSSGPILGSKLTVDAGKTGARWTTRYIRSTAPLKWPAVLAPMPAVNLTSTPEVVRKPIDKGHPLPVKPVAFPAKLK